MSLVERFINEAPETPGVRGFLHRPETALRGALVLTHGAGSNCGAPLLVAMAETFANAGIIVLRCDLPFRQSRPHGPPSGAGAKDRAGLRRAVDVLREMAAPSGQAARVYLGGHSYGGRQASMLSAEDPAAADALLLLSYPLHPPGHPEQPRTAHLANLRTPVLFVHGSRDPFGSLDEMRSSVALIPAAANLLEIEGAGHDLGRSGHDNVASRALAAFMQLVG